MTAGEQERVLDVHGDTTAGRRLVHDARRGRRVNHRIAGLILLGALMPPILG